MYRLKQIAKCRAGFTILEVLIAMAVMGVLTTSIFKLYISQHQNYLIQDDISTIQQNGRAVIDIIARSTRMAGFGTPDAMDALTAYDTNPDTIMLNYRVNGCDVFLESSMPMKSSELKIVGDVSCFKEGEWAYIFSPDSGGGEWFEITNVQLEPAHLQHNNGEFTRTYVKDAIVLSMNQVKFFIDNTTDPDHPSLMIQLPFQDPQQFAENVIDLQFKYRMRSGKIVDKPILIDNIREVIIAVTSRSNLPDLENPDGPYRTRTYTTSVNVRNISKIG